VGSAHTQNGEKKITTTKKNPTASQNRGSRWAASPVKGKAWGEIARGGNGKKKAGIEKD